MAGGEGDLPHSQKKTGTDAARGNGVVNGGLSNGANDDVTTAVESVLEVVNLYDAARNKELAASDAGRELFEQRQKIVTEVHELTNRKIMVEDELDEVTHSKEQLNKILEASKRFAETLATFAKRVEADRNYLKTVIPNVVGTNAAIQCDLHEELHASSLATTLQVVTNATAKVDAELRNFCEEHKVKYAEEWNGLKKRETAQRQRVDDLKARLSKLHKSRKVSMVDLDDEDDHNSSTEPSTKSGRPKRKR